MHSGHRQRCVEHTLLRLAALLSGLRRVHSVHLATVRKMHPTNSGANPHLRLQG